MFTGLITDIGRVRRVLKAGDTTYEIETGFNMDEIAIGASIACSGVCLTAVEKGAGWFAVTASAETLSRTTLEAWREGTRLNLECSLRLGDELGGHFVFGHVDGLATLAVREAEGDSWRLRFEIPNGLNHLVAEKGSVALDGVSLTINDVSDADSTFGVNIIPHTWEMTTLGDIALGGKAHFEADMLARYVARMAVAAPVPQMHEKPERAVL